jgi:hypothetical protein
MCEFFKKIQWKKVLTAGFIYLIIAFIIRQVEAVLTMNYYLMPEYFGVWSKLMMPKAGAPPTSFFLTSILFSFITGVGLAIFYDCIKTLLPKDKWQRILCFTCLITGLSFLFFSLTAFLLFNLPFMLLVWWFISSVVIFFLTAAVFVRILK